MSVDGHECATMPVAAGDGHPATEGTLDVKRIKKEQSDVCTENGASCDGGNGLANDSRPQLQATVNAANNENAPRLSNGFHTGDLFQNILAAKIATLAHHNPASKLEKIRLMIEESISEDSRARIQEIFTQVEQLKIEEKLLLYLKLPISLTNPSGTVDPLRQPLNPLGNRYEIHQTIMWIKTHLEEDPDVSLPKQEVYDEYNVFCTRNSMKPLSTADFGKVMKQVYPRVRPRRLGTRGNSRYCYAGMRKRIKLDPPSLPPVNNTQPGDDADENVSEDMLGAASTLIREWAESVLGLKFPTLCALGRHLVDNLYVDTRSLAAVCIQCTSGENKCSENKETSPVLSAKQPGKLREAQLQLQRKLQQREHIRDQKHRHTDTVLQNQNKEKTVDNKGSNKGNKKSKAAHSPQGTNTPTGQSTLTKVNMTANPPGRQKKVVKSSNQSCNVSSQSNCDNLVVQSIENVQNSSTFRVATANCTTLPKEVKSKNARKRAVGTGPPQQHQQLSGSSPEKQAKLADTPTPSSNENTAVSVSGNNTLTVADVTKLVKNKAIKAAAVQPTKSCDKDSIVCSNSYSKTNGCMDDKRSVLSKDQIRLLQENSNLLVKSEKFCTLDSDALDDYLNGGNNSQEQEEELLQYFQQSNSSSSDMETSGGGGGESSGGGGDGGSSGGGLSVLFDTEQTSRSDKVSQLRQILQENLKAEIAVDNTVLITRRGSVPVEKQQEMLQKHEIILPTLLNHANQTGSTRRRVSFETNVVEHAQDASCTGNTVPQSPNTRRRIFNFTPISPSPHSPINGRASKPSSANASPFVSPRNTPVPRSRSNIQGRTRGAQKTLARSISCSVPYVGNSNSRTDTFIVPTSGPELTKNVGTATKSSEVQVSSSQPMSVTLKSESQDVQCSALFNSDLSTQKQLLINYPSQENLQEIKNVYPKAPPNADREISDLLHGDKQFTREQLLCRSQSVPLHRMFIPTLMSPYLTPFQSPSFNLSSNSSIAPTPVPSEFNDFGSIATPDGGTYLLDDVDANFMSDDQQFLIGDKEITTDNISNILNILGEDDQHILPDNVTTTEEDALDSNNAIMLNTLNITSENVVDPVSVLEPSPNSGISKIIHSRSYPNTPLPAPSSSSFTVTYTEDSNGSRSYPSTPLHNVQQPRETYTETNEPMLSSPTLNTLNMRNEVNNASSSVFCNVSDLLETNIFGETEGENGDLDPLGHFEELQDVESLTPLFNEVVEPNR